MLVDADNLSSTALGVVVRALPSGEASVVVAGRGDAVGPVDWPAGARVHAVAGAQQADRVLLDAYRPGGAPLVLVTGDKDFAPVAQAHAGPVLVVADRPAKALRRAAVVLDPDRDGLQALRAWFDACVDAPWPA